MDIHLMLGLVFVVIMSVLIAINREKIIFQKILFPLLYVVMMRTKLGLGGMNWLAKTFRRPLRWLGYVGVAVGFAGMAFICYELIKGSIMLFLAPAAAPGIQPVLPFQAKGVFYVPFVYWIISIFLIATVHEFAHGVIARVHNMRLKSSGFAFLGVLVPIIPAAFVEPDEAQLARRPARQQLAVFAAGPFSNVLFALLVIFLFGFNMIVPYSVTQHTALVDMTELRNEILDLDSLRIVKVNPGSPAQEQGLPLDASVTSIGGVPVADTDRLVALLDSLKPGQPLVLGTGERDYPVTLGAHPDDPSKGYIGVGFETVTKVSQSALEKYGPVGVQAIQFSSSLLFWVILLNIGIGLFNLLPLGPIDGGRMWNLAMKRVFNEKKGHLIWKYTSIFFLGLIVVNLTVGFVR